MNHKNVRLIVLLLGLGLITKAQQTTTVTGGNASGGGGTASYSIGQVIYTANTSSNGIVTQGVQQPYEISIVLGLENRFINFGVQVYPNPTSDYLTLDIENSELSTLNFQLTDINGRLIENKIIRSNSETIQMEHLPSNVYFLKVINNKEEVKTFKIIKNQK